MAQRLPVPKFGNWESEQNMPYTVYFDNARKGKSARKMINPNEPQENPNLPSRDAPPVQAPPFRTTGFQAKASPDQVHRSSKEDSNLKQPTGSPLHHDSIDRKIITNSPNSRPGDYKLSSGDAPKRAGRGGTDQSFEQSPLHAHYNAKAGGSGIGAPSPISERNGFAPNTPGRSRMKPVSDETAVPKFGEWDERNPASADRFTRIFSKVSREKKGGSARTPIVNTSNPTSSQKQVNKNDDSAVFCCFSWFRK